MKKKNLRSLTLDSWTKKQVLVMETGGNAKAMEYFKKNGAVVHNTIDYKHACILKYKQDLNKKVIYKKMINKYVLYYIGGKYA